jgi:hypothetical protein
VLLGKVRLLPALIPEVVIEVVTDLAVDDCKVVMMDPETLLVDLAVELDEMVAPAEVLAVDAFVDVDPL